MKKIQIIGVEFCLRFVFVFILIICLSHVFFFFLEIFLVFWEFCTYAVFKNKILIKIKTKQINLIIIESKQIYTYVCVYILESVGVDLFIYLFLNVCGICN